jgi:hypothetical protein
MTSFLTSFLGCLAAILLWKWYEKRTRRVNSTTDPITVHEVFDKSREGLSYASTAYIDSSAKRFQVRSHVDTCAGVRNYDYRLINGAVYARLVDDYDDSHYRSPRPRYDVYEGIIMEEDFRARRLRVLILKRWMKKSNT